MCQDWFAIESSAAVSFSSSVTREEAEALRAAAATPTCRLFI